MITLTTFRAEADLIKQAAKLKNNKTYQMMIEVAKNELPTNRTLPAMGAKDTDFAYAYGVEVGYRQALAVLELMGTPPTQSAEEVEASFSEPITND